MRLCLTEFWGVSGHTVGHQDPHFLAFRGGRMQCCSKKGPWSQPSWARAPVCLSGWHTVLLMNPPHPVARDKRLLILGLLVHCGSATQGGHRAAPRLEVACWLSSDWASVAA